MSTRTHMHAYICIHICANILHILNIQFCISVLHVCILRASAQKEVGWRLGPPFKKAFPTFLAIFVCCWEATQWECIAFQCIFLPHTKRTVVRILFFSPAWAARMGFHNLLDATTMPSLSTLTENDQDVIKGRLGGLLNPWNLVAILIQVWLEAV